MGGRRGAFYDEDDLDDGYDDYDDDYYEDGDQPAQVGRRNRTWGALAHPARAVHLGTWAAAGLDVVCLPRPPRPAGDRDPGGSRQQGRRSSRCLPARAGAVRPPAAQAQRQAAKGRCAALRALRPRLGRASHPAAGVARGLADAAAPPPPPPPAAKVQQPAAVKQQGSFPIAPAAAPGSGQRFDFATPSPDDEARSAGPKSGPARLLCLPVPCPPGDACPAWPSPLLPAKPQQASGSGARGGARRPSAAPCLAAPPPSQHAKLAISAHPHPPPPAPCPLPPAAAVRPVVGISLPKAPPARQAGSSQQQQAAQASTSAAPQAAAAAGAMAGLDLRDRDTAAAGPQSEAAAAAASAAASRRRISGYQLEADLDRRAPCHSMGLRRPAAGGPPAAHQLPEHRRPLATGALAPPWWPRGCAPCRLQPNSAAATAAAAQAAAQAAEPCPGLGPRPTPPLDPSCLAQHWRGGGRAGSHQGLPPLIALRRACQAAAAAEAAGSGSKPGLHLVVLGHVDAGERRCPPHTHPHCAVLRDIEPAVEAGHLGLSFPSVPGRSAPLLRRQVDPDGAPAARGWGGQPEGGAQAPAGGGADGQGGRAAAGAAGAAGAACPLLLR
jgi:hypothetical protein